MPWCKKVRNKDNRVMKGSMSLNNSQIESGSMKRSKGEGLLKGICRICILAQILTFDPPYKKSVNNYDPGYWYFN
jgi:hypothetical protein